MGDTWLDVNISSWCLSHPLPNKTSNFQVGSFAPSFAGRSLKPSPTYNIKHMYITVYININK